MKQSVNKQYDEIKQHGISNGKIERYFEQHLKTTPNIVYLSKFEGINTLEDVFRGGDHAVIHVATSGPYIGHWQILLRDKNQLYFFDSYGNPFSKLLKDVFRMYGANAWGQSYKLGELISKSGLKCDINRHKFQSPDSDTESCGYHIACVYAVFKGLSLDNIKFDFNKYKQILDKYKACNKLRNYDDVVIEIFSS